MTTFVSVIVTTYNWESALSLVLKSLDRQSVGNFEVIVADDGSTGETADVINELAATVRYALKHVWQEDKGFRAARCRNRAVLEATGDLIVFLDGDCIVREDFVEQHLRLSESGWFVRGNRVKLSERFTKMLLADQSLLPLNNTFGLMRLWRQRSVGRFFPLMRLPLGKLRYLRKKEWYGVKTCNLGLYKQDFMDVNGFNEDFTGWGHEDADLAIRLIRNGIRRKEGNFATTVFHCYHKEVTRAEEQRNREMLEISRTGAIKIKNGILSKTS